MKKFKSLIAVLVLAMMPAVVGVTTAAPAEAHYKHLRGCDGRWRWQADPWQETVWATAVSPLGGAILDKIVLRANAIYQYCDSSGRKPNKARPMKIDYSMRDVDRHILLVGTEFSPFFMDDQAHISLPGKYLLKDDGNDVSTGTQRIGVNHRPWLRVDKHPVWEINGEIIYKGPWPNESFVFLTADNEEINSLTAHSVPLSGWHRS